MSRIAAVRSWCVALAVVGAAIAAEPSRTEAGGLDVLRTCAADSQLGRAFTRGDLERALERMPADLAEYSDCDEQIASALRGMTRADRLSEAAQRGSGDRAGEGDADGRDGAGSAGGGSGSDTRAGMRPADAVPPGEPDEGVAGTLLSGAEAVGSAPLDVVEAAAEGRLGLPGWVWPLLIVAGLLGVGVVRERRT